MCDYSHILMFYLRDEVVGVSEKVFPHSKKNSFFNVMI